MYNRQNERIYAGARDEADEKGGIHCKTKFSTGVMVWLGVCDQGVTVTDILPTVLKDGKKMLGNEFIFQQDGAKSHIAKNTQLWCKKRWPSNSPDLNPMDYCVWNELCQQINWNRIIDKQTLIHDIKQDVEKIPIEVVHQNVANWINRIYQMLQIEGDYFF
ncbi:unnamed protein product [Rotaria sordida]|uniref:Transposase n=1 Tax=Rotaria sordida TaxID=392033 RepID=A0A818PPG1_9BILA|nr:unnamed protein product [Rotaria sordida]CAF3628803.1 unnamed protein product [Rotaria sordida]CAF3741475.1 unnamed protein product [Rotaria sordida]